MAKWKIYIKWGSVKEVHPLAQIESGRITQLTFYCKRDAQNYFNKSFFKEYKANGWIIEYEIKKEVK